MVSATKAQPAKPPALVPGRVSIGLRGGDGRLHESIAREIDYVDHPDFLLAGTEEELFGPEAENVAVAEWRQFQEVYADAAAQRTGPSLLTRRQEVLLFKRYNYAKYRLGILVSMQQQPIAASLTAEMLLWYCRLQAGRAVLVNANAALAVAMAKRARADFVEFGDLVSEGNMALLRAIDKFDVRRGFKFSTYCCRAILSALSRLAKRAGTYCRRFPTVFEQATEQSDELDRRHHHNRDLAIEDLQRVLAGNSAGLTDVERTVVGARFALCEYKQANTLEQVGRLVSLSKEGVRQVQKAALAKLRTALVEVAS